MVDRVLIDLSRLGQDSNYAARLKGDEKLPMHAPSPYSRHQGRYRRAFGMNSLDLVMLTKGSRDRMLIGARSTTDSG